MFVRLLILLISHILRYFSDLVCCRYLVQFVVQRGGIKQRWNLGPCQCDRAHLVRSSACLVSRISRIFFLPPSLHWLRHGNSEAVTLDRSHISWSNALQLNPYRPEIEHTACDLTHTGLRSSAPPAIELTPNLAEHLILSINSPFMFPCKHTFWRRLEAPSTARILPVLHCKHS